MLRSLPKLLLAATSFAPVMLTSAVVFYAKGQLLLSCWLVVATVTATVVCLVVIKCAAKQLSKNSVSIKSIKPADREMVAFILVCLIPLVQGIQFDVLSLFVVLVVFFLIVMTSNTYHTNPLLGLFSYHFYDVMIDDVCYTLISHRTPHNAKAIKEVVSLTDYVLLDVTR